MGEIVALSRSERATMVGEALAGRLDLTGRFLCFRGPGAETVPVKEAVVRPVTVFFKRATVKLPVAPANRPVPPVMIAVSTMGRTFGGVNVAFPLIVPNTVSPFAAVNRNVPLPR